ncbi:hypothetical protein BJA5080_05866 [Bradyrhizobium diazoefficiens SEMIA 5080]|uniref:Uncharacterized protein n=1 Tax=Bradyrhizobium diazoefficiens SEMIA 5080 TaxID=754504 RepID=A0A837C5K2_9BRAD|nr:hypothetical protein BJA5080_05866 [Bradyrhizobium diazoefficiens SEMIA 5080]
MTCLSLGRERLVQLLILTVAQGVVRRVMAADQAHELLRVHLVTVIAGILVRHRRTTDVVRLRARLLRPALI